MKEFGRILLASDSREDLMRLLDAARCVNVSNTGHSTITVLSVLEGPTREMELLGKDIRKLFEELILERKAALESAAKGTPLNIKVVPGTRFLEITKEAIRGGYDLLLKTAENISGARRLIFGSTDMHLLRKCPCQVLIVKPEGPARFSRVVAAVAPNPLNDDRSLDLKILEHAGFLARACGGTLDVVHAWDMPMEKVLRVRGWMSDQEVDVIVSEARERHDKSLKGLLEALGLDKDPAVRTHLVRGEPVEVITELTRRLKADVIVMGTIARSGIPGFFIGNTAENIISQVDSSILAVKPDWFVSPVLP